MALSYKKIIQMSNDEIYYEVFPIIKKIYYQYNILNLSDKELKSILEQEIIRLKKYYTDEKSLKIFQKNIRNIFKELLQSKIQDKSECLNTLNQLIDTLKLDKQDELNDLNKINKIFLKYNIIVDPDIIINLINTNKTFNNILKKFVDKNIELIKNNKLDNIIDEGNIIIFIETYCMLNNINIENNLFSELVEKDFYITDDDYKSLDSVKMYLNEIGKLPLLTLEEEKKLTCDLLNKDEKAKKILIERNLRLVVGLAKRYIGKGLSFLDLIQEGNIGLMTAVDKYDMTKGYRFATYAVHWIRQSITRAICDKGRNIRIPVHLQEKMGRFTKIKRELEIKLGRNATIEEIAKQMNIPFDEAKKLYKYHEDTISINSFIKEGEDEELEDFIPSKESTEDSVINIILPEEIKKMFDMCNLKQREKDILALRFGLYNSKTHTLEEIGKMYGLTRERIRQIESSAIKKIRMSKYIKAFSVYTENQKESLESLTEYRNKYKKHLSSNKAYLKESESLNNKKREVKSIYDLLKDYPKEQIDKTILKLNESDKKLIDLRYGENLEKPVTSPEWTEADAHKFYGYLLPKIKRLIISNGTKSNKNRKLQTIYEYFNNYTKAEINIAIKKLSEKDKELMYLRYGENLENPKTNPKWTSKHAARFYSNTINKMKRLLEEPDYQRKKKKTQTIYEYLNEYTREQIDEALTKISENDKELIRLKYGNDLNNPVTSPEWTQKHAARFYSNTINKMKRLLKDPDCQRKKIKIQTIYEYLNEYTREQIDEALTKISEKDKELIRLKYGNDLNNPVTSPEWTPKHAARFYNNTINKIKRILKDPSFKPYSRNNKSNEKNISISKEETKEIITPQVINKTNIIKEDYIEMLRLLKTPTFNDLMSVLTPKEAIIIALKLGYIDGKYFSTESIANFLGMKDCEVRDITKKILKVYKEKIANLNNYIDTAIRIEEDEIKVLSYNPNDKNK